MGGAALLRAEVREPGTIRRAYLYEPIVLPAGPAFTTGGNVMADGAIRVATYNLLNLFDEDPPLTVQTGTFQRGYDPRFTDPLGRTTNYVYDALNRMTAKDGPSARCTT